MNILTLLPSEQSGRMRLASSPTDRIQATANPIRFMEMAESGEWDILVVEPELAPEKQQQSFLERLSGFSAPMILYTALSRSSAAAIASLSANAAAGIVLFDFDDSPDMLRNALARLPIELFGAQLVARIGSAVDDLPVPARRATLGAYCSVRLLTSTTEYATLCRTPRRTLDRWLQGVGSRPARWIVATAQFLRAWPLLQSPVTPLAVVSRVSGYGSVRALRHNALKLTGNELNDLRAHFATFDVVGLMEQALRI